LRVRRIYKETGKINETSAAISTTRQAKEVGSKEQLRVAFPFLSFLILVLILF